MIHFFEEEVKHICNFISADKEKVLSWLEANRTTDKYITFEIITNMGQTMFTLTYGKNLGSIEEVVCHVSSLGTQFQE